MILGRTHFSFRYSENAFNKNPALLLKQVMHYLFFLLRSVGCLVHGIPNRSIANREVGKFTSDEQGVSYLSHPRF